MNRIFKRGIYTLPTLSRAMASPVAPRQVTQTRAKTNSAKGSSAKHVTIGRGLVSFLESGQSCIQACFCTAHSIPKSKIPKDARADIHGYKMTMYKLNDILQKRRPVAELKQVLRDLDHYCQRLKIKPVTADSSKRLYKILKKEKMPVMKVTFTHDFPEHALILSAKKTENGILFQGIDPGPGEQPETTKPLWPIEKKSWIRIDPEKTPLQGKIPSFFIVKS